ncbi:MAG TPA: hypothetical protein VLA62_11080, partial [Solirubrobacterales bacterium]|nr:hypothetical protein [Solirubrobacterales bacterium]
GVNMAVCSRSPSTRGLQPIPRIAEQFLQRVFGFQGLMCDRCRGLRRILGAVTEPQAGRRVRVALGLAAEPPPGAPPTA